MTIPYFITAMDGNPRNKNLIDKLLSNNLKVKIIQGLNGNLFYDEELNRAGLIDLGKLTKKYKTRLTSTELCCAIAHIDVVNYAYTNVSFNLSEWIVVLEDDVDINQSTIELIDNLNESFKYISRCPTIISLYADSYICEFTPIYSVEINNKSFELFHCLIPPTSAVCYMINKSAIMKIFLSGKKVSDRSDWPRFYSDFIDFKVVLPASVSTSLFPSQIDDYHKKRLNTRATQLKGIYFIRHFLNKILNIFRYDHLNQYFVFEWKATYLFILKKFNFISVNQKGYW